MNVTRVIPPLFFLLFPEVPGVHCELLLRKNQRRSISALLPDFDPLISQMDLHDNKLSMEFWRKLDVSIECFDGEISESIFANDAKKKEKRLLKIHEIRDAFQGRGRGTGRCPQKGCRPAVVGITSRIELLESGIDLLNGIEVMSLPELPVEDGVCPFDGSGVPGTPRSVKDDDDSIVAPPSDVASHHAFLIDGTAEARTVVLLHDIGKRQSASEKDDGENAKSFRSGRCLDAEEELLLLRMDVAETEEVDGGFVSLNVPRTDEIHLHHRLTDRSQETDRVEHVL